MDSASEHPLRYALVNELHARPSPRIGAPATCVFLAFKDPVNAVNRDSSLDFRHLSDLTSRHGGPRSDPDERHYSGQLGRYQLKWESHAEFVTYMALTPGLPSRPFDPGAAAVFPDAWQKQATGKRVAAVMIQVDLLPDDPQEALDRAADWFAIDGQTAVWILDEDAMIAGDFRIDPDGWMRFAVFVRPHVGQGRIGRIVHRLAELETYRAMSMLGFQRARALSDRLNQLEPRLSSLVAAMTDDARPAEAVLHELLAVSAELEAEAVHHSFRFGATSAYEAIVTDRITALRETRLLGRQTLTEFMRRRYLPAMRTVKSAEQRLRTLTERANRAGELLRTRVDVERSAQNQIILESMNRRAEMQLRLQHTVEGLSVFAISYYAVGLLSYALYPLAHGLGIEKPLMIAGLTPLVVMLVWWSIWRIRKHLHKSENGAASHG